MVVRFLDVMPIVDPHGIHLADFAAKSDGLQDYIAKRGRKVFGGIVANTDLRSFIGQWMVYEGNDRDMCEGDWIGWTRLAM